MTFIATPDGPAVPSEEGKSFFMLGNLSYDVLLSKVVAASEIS